MSVCVHTAKWHNVVPFHISSYLLYANKKIPFSLTIHNKRVVKTGGGRRCAVSTKDGTEREYI